MACRYDPDDDDRSLVIREVGGELAVYLWNRRPFMDGPPIVFCAQIAGAGLRAEVHEVWCVGIGDGETDLAEFVARLSDDFAGWQGTRSWRSSTGDMAVEAAYRAGGHVDVAWTLSRGGYPASSQWSATAVVVVEAGEQMKRLAADLHHFLHPEA